MKVRETVWKILGRFRIPGLLVCLAVFGLLLGACGSDEPEIDPARYDGWKHYQYGHFHFVVSPESRWYNDLTELTKGYERWLHELCDLLEMPVPSDTITMYIYSAGPEDEEITGRHTPFSTETEIHWGNKYPYGYELTRFLLRRRGYEPGRFEVINQGIPFLLDYSGMNYHDKTNRRVNSGVLYGLARLGDEAHFDSLDFAPRRAEAASLTGFIMYDYGVNRLFMLAESSADWKRSIETIFQVPMVEFERTWLAFAREQSNDPEGTVDDDPVEDMRIYTK